MVAKRAAILAHGHAQRADFMVIGGVKKAGQDGKRPSYKMHCTLRKGIDLGCSKNKRPRWLSRVRVLTPILARGRFESSNKLVKIVYIALAGI
jgi:hypothetical protein